MNARQVIQAANPIKKAKKKRAKYGVVPIPEALYREFSATCKRHGVTLASTTRVLIRQFVDDTK